MKKMLVVFILCSLTITLTACGGKEASVPVTGAESAQQYSESPAEPAGIEATLLSVEEVVATATARVETGAPVEGAAPTAEPPTVPADPDRPVDLDLTKLSGTVVYSQVYDMMMEPEHYMGQKIKLKGSFSYFQDPGTQQEYFAAVIADATACCAQGIEFVWKGEHSYPKDYPP